MDRTEQWRVITRPEEVVRSGIYQEKTAIVCPTDQQSEFNRLIKIVQDAGGEVAPLPPELEAAVKKEGLLAFAFWANKQDPVISEKELRAGNLRLKIVNDK